jgi:hypothetical protein
MGLSEAALDQPKQTFPQSIRLLAQAQPAPKGILSGFFAWFIAVAC